MATPNWIDVVLDNGLNEIASNSTQVDVCSAEPANFAGIAAVTLAAYTLTAGQGNGDWTLADGDVSGRKLTMTQQTGNNGTATGAGTHLAFSNGTTTLYGVIAADGQTVNSGSPVTINAVDVWEIQDPT